MKPSPSKTPIWETLTIIASFAGVWIYFFAWLAAGRAKIPLSPYWQFLLLPCLVALFFVFKKRLARARDAVREAKAQSSFPSFGRPNPPSNHKSKNTDSQKNGG